MRLKRNVQREPVTEQEDDGIRRWGIATELESGQLADSTREARFRIYSCVFCEFVRENTSETDEDQNRGTMRDPIFEAKYLHHLKTYHSLER